MDRRIIDLYNATSHSAMTRRVFMAGTAMLAVGAAALAMGRMIAFLLDHLG